MREQWILLWVQLVRFKANERNGGKRTSQWGFRDVAFGVKRRLLGRRQRHGDRHRIKLGEWVCAAFSNIELR